MQQFRILIDWGTSNSFPYPARPRRPCQNSPRLTQRPHQARNGAHQQIRAITDSGEVPDQHGITMGGHPLSHTSSWTPPAIPQTTDGGTGSTWNMLCRGQDQDVYLQEQPPRSMRHTINCTKSLSRRQTSPWQTLNQQREIYNVLLQAGNQAARLPLPRHLQVPPNIVHLRKAKSDTSSPTLMPSSAAET